MTREEVQTPPAAFSRGDGRKKKKAPKEDRFGPGTWAKWRRVRDNPDSFYGVVQLGCNESLGSQLAILFGTNQLDEAEANAGRHFAELAGKYDRHHGITRRGLRSPAYETGRAGRDDEVVRAERTDTIVDYERRARRIKTKWRKSCDAIGNEKLLGLLEEVCIHDQHCALADRAALKAGLAILARRWGFNVPDHGRTIVSHHEPGAKLGSKGRFGKRRNGRKG
jgi:hypothetical protein